jgi:signal peptidase I
VSPAAKRSKSTTSSIVELVVIVVVAIGLAIAIQAFIVKPYRIPSGSMEPTLSVGQRVLVDRVFSEPHVGEIAVFHPPEGAVQGQCGLAGEGRGTQSACSVADSTVASVNFIKRIVAGPGDVISIVQGHVIRNGVHEKDGYIRPCAVSSAAECNFPRPIRIPAGRWFMMGDNRGESDDSRFWGPVPKGWIIGGAFATYWPPGRVGIF